MDAAIALVVTFIYEWYLSYSFSWFQGSGFPSMCVFKCFFKYHPCEKALGNWLQGNGFSPECVLECFFKSPPSEKALGQLLQGNGFSPECVLKERVP